MPRNQSVPDFPGAGPYMQQGYPSHPMGQYQSNMPPMPMNTNNYNPQQQQPQHARSTSWGGEPVQQRTDQPIFTRAHPIVSFGFGGKMVMLRSGSNARAVQVVPIKDLIGHSTHYSNLASFPGPLTNSSKDTVNRWIGERIADIGAGRIDTLCSRDPEASNLLWEMLRVLNNNAGQISDNEKNIDRTIQRLLLDNKSSQTAFPVATLAHQSPDTIQMHLNEIQRLLIHGDMVAAHKVACDSQQWSHALVLAHCIGVDVYSRTLHQFTSATVPAGAPVRTLYSLFSNNTRELFRELSTPQASPALLECWKENVASLLFNGKAYGLKVIGEIGDAIWALQKRAEAAHVCYLLADYQFGAHGNPNSRIVLLGGDHKVSSNYITTESLQRSEIYEFGKTLGNSQYSLPQILVYKFVYATLLCDLGLVDQSTKYLQSIKTTLKNHQITNPNFIYQLDTFSERLLNFTSSNKSSSSGSWIPSIFKGFGILGGGKKPTAPTVSHAAPAVSVTSTVVTPVKEQPMPMFNKVPVQPQPPVMVQQPPVPAPSMASSKAAHIDDDEDLYSSFSTNKTPVKSAAVPPAPAADDSTDAAKGLDDKPEDSESKSSGWWPWKKKSTSSTQSKEMKLNDENSFIYNEELGMWVEKGKPLPVAAAPLPPPPMGIPPTSAVASSPGTSSPPNGMGGGSPLPPGMHQSPRGDLGPAGDEGATQASPGVNRYSTPGGKRRPRYVDTINQQVYSGSSSSTPNKPSEGSNLTPSIPIMTSSTPMPPSPYESSSPMQSAPPEVKYTPRVSLL
eukprot:gene5701-6585_t